MNLTRCYTIMKRFKPTSVLSPSGSVFWEMQIAVMWSHLFDYWIARKLDCDGKFLRQCERASNWDQDVWGSLCEAVHTRLVWGEGKGRNCNCVSSMLRLRLYWDCRLTVLFALILAIVQLSLVQSCIPELFSISVQSCIVRIVLPGLNDCRLSDWLASDLSLMVHLELNGC